MGASYSLDALLERATAEDILIMLNTPGAMKKLPLDRFADPANAIRIIYEKLGGEFVVSYIRENYDVWRTDIAKAARSDGEMVIKVLKIFTAPELENLMVEGNSHRYPLLSILTPDSGYETIKHLYEQLGAERCITLMLEKNDSGDSVIANGAENWQMEKFVRVLKIFRPDELKRVLHDRNALGNNLMFNIMVYPTTKREMEYIYATLGGECITLMLEKNTAGASAVTKSIDRIGDISEIFELFSDSAELERILADQNANGDSTMHHIVSSDEALRLVKYVYKKLGGKKCLGLLLIQNQEGSSSVSLAQKREVGQFIDFLKIFNEAEVKTIAESQNEDGCSIIDQHRNEDSSNTLLQIFHSIEGASYINLLSAFSRTITSAPDFQKYREFFNICIDKLALTCNGGNDAGNCRNLAINFLDEIKWPSEWKTEKKKVAWIRKQLRREGYMLVNQPSILLISNSRERPGADKEAASLIKVLEALGLNVTVHKDLTKNQVLDAIDETQTREESKTSQILIMMSHGSAGHIHDNRGIHSPIKDLQERMCPPSHENSPKVLILQCCQNSGTLDLAPNFSRDSKTKDSGRQKKKSKGEKKPKPRSISTDAKIPGDQATKTTNSDDVIKQDFCVIKSCVIGQVSFRNEFIPRLATALQKLSKTQDIYDAFLAAHRSLQVNQTPILLTTMQYTYSLKNIFNPDSKRRFKPSCVS